MRLLAESFGARNHERAFNFYDAEIEWDASDMKLPSDITGIHHGHDGIRTFWRGWLQAWKDLDFEVEDILDGGDEILMLIRNQRQWGRHSGIETVLPPYGMLFTIRGGKVQRVRYFSDREEALEAAGLSEDE